MFRYYLKLAALSIRKNPILSALMVAAIATGIGACMTIINIRRALRGDTAGHSALLHAGEFPGQKHSPASPAIPGFGSRRDAGLCFLFFVTPFEDVEFDKSERDKPQEGIPEVHKIAFDAPVDRRHEKN